MLGVKQVIFKSRKVQSEFCTICEEFLSGDGTIVRGWECECGNYEFSWSEGRYLHPTEVKPKHTIERLK